MILLAVVLASLPNVLGVSLSYQNEAGPLFWLARAPWAICLVLVGVLYGRKAYRVAPLALTAFIAFPELFLYGMLYLSWGVFGYAP